MKKRSGFPERGFVIGMRCLIIYEKENDRSTMHSKTDTDIASGSAI